MARQHTKTTATRISSFVLLVVGVVTQSQYFLFLPLVSAQTQTLTQLQTNQLVATTSEPSSLSLKSILEHQNAIAKECAEWQKQTQAQLVQLADFDRAHQTLELPNPLPVKIPAVCLFLLESDGSARAPEQRLQMVNWIYESDQWSQLVGSKKNMTKRELPVGDVDPNNQLLKENLFDIESLMNKVDADEDDPVRHEFHEQVDTMLHDERFQDAIDKGRSKIGTHLSPVILVPGLLGSRLQARTNKQRKVNVFCSKQSDWQDLWLSVRMFLPLAVDCWLDNVRLEFDPSTGFTRTPPGVESRVPDFGSVESVRHLDLRSPALTNYFAPLIERYEQLGYTADKNLLAAPYDFRLAPQQLIDTFFKDLRHLIEDAQAKSPSNQKITLVCHSMGCNHLLGFLRNQSPAWRQNRIRKLIALSSPWAGAIKALKALIVGDQLDLPLVSEVKMRKLARTYPSIAYLLPHDQYFAQPNKFHSEAGSPVVVQTPQRIYKLSDMEQLLKDLGMEQQWKWFQSTRELIDPKEPLPDIDVDCIHSMNIPTPAKLIYHNQTDFPNGDYELITGEGDGTVNYESLMVCAQWAQKLPQRVKHKVIMNTNHVAVLKSKALLTHITDDVLTS